jgi:DNA repair exonuclease SbcCD ATPase subunit
MPNQYKEKKCPVCSITHRKRGLFCSQSCANSNQTKTPEHVKNIKKSIAEYQNSPEGLANAQRQSLRLTAMHNDTPLPVTIEDFCVDLPDFPPELPEGYDHAEKW